MADLVKVQFTGGGEGTVSREWVERWPDDIAAVLDDAKPTDVATADLEPLVIPPLSGKGSGAENWRDYAAAAAEREGITLAIAAEAGRDEIVTLLADAGIATTAPETDPSTGTTDTTEGTKEATQ